MTHDSTKHADTGPDFGDLELEQLLGDAYDAPQVPRTLSRRIRRELDLHASAADAVAGGTAALSPRGMRRSGWRRAVPVVVGIAASLLLAILVIPTSGSAWAAVLQAVAQRGVVQLSGPDDTRWLSLSSGAIGARSQQSVVLIDLDDNYSLSRGTDDVVAERRQLGVGNTHRPHDQLLVAFLTGRTDDPSAIDDLAGLQLIDEQSQMVTRSGRRLQSLDLRFETAENETIALRLLVDPKTHLPVALDGPSGEDVPLSYPTANVTELRERDFPSSLVVVEADDVASDLAAATGAVDSQDSTQVAIAEPAGDLTHSDAVAANPDAQPTDGSAPSEPFRGVPSSWQPVASSSFSSGEIVQQIDAELERLWQKEGIEPVEPGSDEELMRRVYLDLAGRTPSVSEARAYLDDASPDRYERLVDRLLASPDHASHLAAVWRTFLIPEGIDLAAFGGIEAFDRWLAEQFASGDTYDQIVRRLLLAEGRLSRSGPLLFYSALKLDPDQLAARTSRVFLGMRLECAQCHDHPFEPWLQEDFWGLAAFFAQISRPQAELETVSTVMQVRDVDRGDVMLPESDAIIAPKFLDGSIPAAQSAERARRKQLAAWLTGADNPYFARATANRVWGQMFGRGIVDPIDDFGLQNEPVSPELLDLLAGHFIAQDFDLDDLFRTIALSKAYRLSSGAATADERRSRCFAQMNVKMLSAEQMYDCITVATLLGSDSTDGTGVDLIRFGNSGREAFLRQFRTPAGVVTDYQGGIPQALTLMNGTLVQNATGVSSSGILKSLEAPFFTNEQRVEILYLATLSRRPNAAEWQRLRPFLPDGASAADVQETLADVLWALLNSAEFAMNH